MKKNNDGIMPNAHNFFIEKLKSDKPYRTEVFSLMQFASKKEIRDDIAKLRKDISNQNTINSKIFISVKELEEMYSISESQQKTYEAE